MSLKIDDRRKKGFINFKCINPGFCFETKEGLIYRKFNSGNSAVCLTNLLGVIDFQDECKVKPVDIIIVIKK